MSHNQESAREGGNDRLRQARRLKRLTQEAVAHELTDLAERLHAAGELPRRTSISVRQYRRWESMSSRWPHKDHRLLLERFFGQSTAALGFAPHQPEDRAPLEMSGDRDATGSGNLLPMRRRTVLTTGAALGLMAAAQPGLPWLTTVTPDQESAGPGRQELELLRQSALNLDAIDQRYGGDQLVATARAHLMWIGQLLERDTYPDGIARDLRGIAGQFTISLGWFCYDADQQGSARMHYADGLSAALSVNDNPLATRVLSNMALQSVHLDKGREALKFARLAQVCADEWAAPPRVIALLAVREAQAFAVLGDEPAFQRAIRRAWTAFDLDVTDRDPHWAAFLNPAEMKTLEGAGRLTLGQYAHAVRLLAEAAESQPLEYSRNRVMALGNLAHAAVKADDIDRAVEAVAGSLDLVESGLSSTRAKRRLAEVRDGLTPYRASGQVREVTERLIANIA
ncbi:hypothetical protein DQ384_34715 [Sphaerisporangium album]|uniref:XRE family transcriptional regulator n=1 Tax=Sphaerisporangium album TaxID=509200 RepID=A0A367EXN6_9ACTN|nr:hypothetical protein [Sphaerisporangium album]RCG22761.1 hypothetical protein DQ384_34715 [Sphaerisporangium album]